MNYRLDHGKGMGTWYFNLVTCIYTNYIKTNYNSLNRINNHHNPKYLKKPSKNRELFIKLGNSRGPHWHERSMDENILSLITLLSKSWILETWSWLRYNYFLLHPTSRDRIFGRTFGNSYVILREYLKWGVLGFKYTYICVLFLGKLTPLLFN